MFIQDTPKLASDIWARGVVVSHPLSMREALGSIPSESTFLKLVVALE